MAALHPFLSEFSEGVWLDQWRVEEAERNFVAHSCGVSNARPATATSQAATGSGSGSSLIREIEEARQTIRNSLQADIAPAPASGPGEAALQARLTKVESENKRLSGVVDDMRLLVKNLENRIITLETGGKATTPAAPAKPQAAAVENGVDSDDDIDLFGSDDEVDEEAEKIKQERLKQYAEKKSKKPTLIAKSNIILDVKPWDDETDMGVLEKEVRKIQMDGLLWGASKLVPVGYGIKKLQISCVVEDDKVSTDDLEDAIVGIEDYIQSMDIAAFNKV